MIHYSYPIFLLDPYPMLLSAFLPRVFSRRKECTVRIIGQFTLSELVAHIRFTIDGVTPRFTSDVTLGGTFFDILFTPFSNLNLCEPVECRQLE